MKAVFTPREIVGELDRYIVGQRAAKRAVAIALRNRWRRFQVDPELRDEIAPKNIIMIGPTGVGKTEIARRLARLAQAPFVKVEASKFTEVGYVGRDVDSMIRDLVEVSVQLVRDEETARVRVRAQELAEERLLDLLLPRAESRIGIQPQPAASASEQEAGGRGSAFPPAHETREKLREMLRAGKFDERAVEVDVPDRSVPMMQVFSNAGLEEMGINLQEMFGGGGPFGRRTKKRKVKVPEARALIELDEAAKLVDQDAVIKEAVARAEDSGIVFIDEIDKIAGREGTHGPDVSREGVQRDILPIVEGSTVTTKYGVVKTDHILFIAAGAFHVSKVGDLIPELQGRFPIRVELEPLTKEDLVRILVEPKNSLTRQYTALLATEGVELSFTSDGIDEIARIAEHVNQRQQNIGARRLHTVMERLLDEVSFSASEGGQRKIVVDEKMVRERLADIVASEDLSRYIL